MAEVQYNGVILSNCRTVDFRQEPVFSGDGSGDYLYTKYTVSVDSVFNSETHPGLDFDLVNASATSVMQAVKQQLATPRASFVYAINGEDLLVSPPAGARTSTQAGKTVDANLGPVTSVHVKSLSENTFIVCLTVTTWICDCSGGSAIISNRWTSDFEIDEEQYVRIVVQGKVVTRADLNVNPDTLRGVLAPSIFYGFVRKSAHYTIHENGLSLDYRYEDQEVYRVPPQPAYTAEGDFKMSSPEGAQLFSEGRLKLTSWKGQSNQALLGLCLMLLMRKVIGKDRLVQAGGVPKKKNGYILRGFSMGQRYEANEVEASMRVSRRPPQKVVKDNDGHTMVTDLAGFLNSDDRNWYFQDKTTNMADVNNQIPPTPALYGSSALLANLAYLRDPCTSKAARPPASFAIATSVSRATGGPGVPTTGR